MRNGELWGARKMNLKTISRSCGTAIQRIIPHSIHEAFAGYFKLAPEKWPDISSVKADLEIPPLSTSKPGPGIRTREILPGWEHTSVYHVLYLPKDWEPSRKYPVIVEYTGNGGFKSKFGDFISGRPEDSQMGYGLTEGKEFIWLCLPYLNETGDAIALTWWGDRPDHSIASTLKYCHESVAWIISKYGGDPKRVILSGFSRGAIACNYLGLHDDSIAKLWCGFVPFSHYDGVRTQWPYWDANRASALERLKRLGQRPQFICHEDTGADETQKYLAEVMPTGNFTFTSIGFRNHNDGWGLRPCRARNKIRKWLQQFI